MDNLPKHYRCNKYTGRMRNENLKFSFDIRLYFVSYRVRRFEDLITNYLFTLYFFQVL